jgi:hypothetical protein
MACRANQRFPVKSDFSDFPKMFSFRPDANQLISFHVSPTEGRIAIVTNAGWDAVDAAASGVTRGWQGGLVKGP